MTSSESNDLMPAQEKLEWVTPKILLMEAGDTDAKSFFKIENSTWAVKILGHPVGPS